MQLTEQRRATHVLSDLGVRPRHTSGVGRLPALMSWSATTSPVTMMA